MVVWVSKCGYAKAKFTENAIFLQISEWLLKQLNRVQIQEAQENRWEQRERKNKQDSKIYKRCYSQKEPNLEEFRKAETEVWPNEVVQLHSGLSD